MDKQRYKAFTIHDGDPQDVNSVIEVYLEQYEADGSKWRLHSIGMLGNRTWWGMIEKTTPAKVDTHPS